MKTNLLRTSIAAVLAAAAACAQSSISLDANVPFDFIAGGKALPAGHYSVDRGPGNTLLIRCREHKSAALAMANPVYSPNSRQNARLVFHHYGDTYFLSEVWGTGTDGEQLPAGRQERQLAAAATSTSNTVMARLR